MDVVLHEPHNRSEGMEIEPELSAELSESASLVEEPIDLDMEDSEHVPVISHYPPLQDLEPKIEHHRNKELHIWAEEVLALTCVKSIPLTNSDSRNVHCTNDSKNCLALQG